jgi:hypothetical protein
MGYIQDEGSRQGSCFLVLDDLVPADQNPESNPT